MTEVTGITRTTGMTRGQGPYPFLNQKFKDFQGHIIIGTRMRLTRMNGSNFACSVKGGIGPV